MYTIQTSILLSIQHVELSRGAEHYRLTTIVQPAADQLTFGVSLIWWWMVVVKLRRVNESGGNVTITPSMHRLCDRDRQPSLVIQQSSIRDVYLSFSALHLLRTP